MKKSLLILSLTGIMTATHAQSTLYQTSKYKALDESYELFDKHLFSASKYEFAALKEKDLDTEPQVQSDFYHAVSALKIENPGSSDLVYYFIREYEGHPKTNEAAHFLGDFFFDNRNYREAIPAYQKVNVEKVHPDQRSEVLFKTGYAYFQLKDQNSAIRYFNQVKSQAGEYRADAYYYAGFIAMEQGNFDQATVDFKEAEKTNFYQGKVPYMLAGIYYRQGKYDELIAYAEPLIESKRTLDRKEEIHLYLAEAYYEKRNFPKAASNYDAFVNARRGDLARPQVYKAGIAQFEIENYQRATDYFKVSAVENDKIGQVSSYYLGHAYVKLNNPQFAANSFSAAYKSDIDPQIKEDALISLAKVNLERGNFQEALTALDNYMENYPNGRHIREAENLLTDALINTNNYLRAIEQIEGMPRKSDRIREAYQKITFYQGIVYYRDRKYDMASTFFDKSIGTPVDRDLVLEAYFWKGENYAANEDLENAIRAYESIQAARPNRNNPILVKSYYGLGYALYNTENYDKAESQFRNYIEQKQGSTDPENYDEALIRLGDIYYVQKKFEQSQNIFQRAIRENNEFIDYAYFRSGVVYNFQNRNTQAIQQMSNLIDTYRNSLYLEDAIFQKAQINMEETNYADARDGFGRLITTRQNSPFIPYALEGRAVANFSLQNYDAAIEDYRKIVENHPNSSNAGTALVGLQEALTLQGRSGEFSQYASRYRSANPDNSSLQNLEFESAKSLYFNNNHDQAIKAFEDYLRNYPQSGNRNEATYFIGDAHYKAGRKEQALNFFYQLDGNRESSQRIRAVQRIASIEVENKNYEKALPYLREASKNARNQIEEYEALQGLMQAHFETNRMDSAIHYSNRVIALGNITGDAVPQAMLLQAKAQLRSNQSGKAEETLRNLVDDFKTIHGAEGLYLLAESVNKKGDFGQSNDIIFDFSGPYSGYDYWYGRTFILLSENYIQLGEEFQAKATLESIVENTTNAEVKNMAQQKLASIR